MASTLSDVPSSPLHSLPKAVQSFPNLIYCPTQPHVKLPATMSLSLLPCFLFYLFQSSCHSSKFAPKFTAISTSQISFPVQPCLPFCVLFKWHPYSPILLHCLVTCTQSPSACAACVQAYGLCCVLRWGVCLILYSLNIPFQILTSHLGLKIKAK